MTLSEERAIANGNRKWTVNEKREATTAVTEYRKAVDDERTAIKAEKAETRAEEKLKAAETTLANRNRQKDERQREAEMKAEEERSSAEAALSLRVDNLQKYYTDLVNEQHLRRQEKLQEEAYERSRKDERQQETATKTEERNIAEAVLKAETRAEEKRIATLTGMVIERIKIIQEKTGVTSIDRSGEEFTITGSPQAVKEADAAIREIIEEVYRSLDLQEEAYERSRRTRESGRQRQRPRSGTPLRPLLT